MTEEEWMISEDPRRMLECVTGVRPGGQPVYGVGRDARSITYSDADRKLRLFAVAVCRQVWDGMACERCGGKKNSVGDIGPTGFGRGVTPRGRPNCHGTRKAGGLEPMERRFVEDVEATADGAQSALGMVGMPTPLCGDLSRPAAESARRVLERFPLPAIQAALMRCLFGNPWLSTDCLRLRCLSCGRDKSFVAAPLREGGPGYEVCAVCGFRAECPLDTWLAWDGGIVPRLARHVYDERSWGDLPILADMLEEAGCRDEDVLNHLRGPGPHGRGCWVLDLLLGKE